jgi:hypothetical protein
MPRIPEYQIRVFDLGHGDTMDMCDGRVYVGLPDNETAVAGTLCNGIVGVNCGKSKICCLNVSIQKPARVKQQDSIYLSFWEYNATNYADPTKPTSPDTFQKLCFGPGRYEELACIERFLGGQNFAANVPALEDEWIKGC